MKLTDAQIKRTKPNVKPYRLSDQGGLFLWVTPSGGKMWRWAYRHEGRAKLMTIGKYPEVTLELARERDSVARRQLATGIFVVKAVRSGRVRLRSQCFQQAFPQVLMQTVA